MNTVLRGRDGLEVVIGRDGPFTPIGERLNPTNKPKLQRAYDSGDWAYVQRDAKRQVTAGARVIDVNTGDPHHRSEEHTSELQSLVNLVCRLLLEKKNNTI